MGIPSDPEQYELWLEGCKEGCNKSIISNLAGGSVVRAMYARMYAPGDVVEGKTVLSVTRDAYANGFLLVFLITKCNKCGYVGRHPAKMPVRSCGKCANRRFNLARIIDDKTIRERDRRASEALAALPRPLKPPIRPRVVFED